MFKPLSCDILLFACGISEREIKVACVVDSALAVE
jgi:hypothetical protein